MSNINVQFHIPTEINEGLRNGTLVRKGGVIVKKENNEIVAWLRESAETIKTEPSNFSWASCKSINIANLGLNIANLGATIYLGVQNIKLTREAISEIKNTQRLMSSRFDKLTSDIKNQHRVSYSTDFSISWIKTAESIKSKKDKNEIKKNIYDLIRYIPQEMEMIISSDNEEHATIDSIISIFKIASSIQSLVISHFDDYDSVESVMRMIDCSQLIAKADEIIARGGFLSPVKLAYIYINPISYDCFTWEEREVIFDMLMASDRPEPSMLDMFFDRESIYIIHDRYIESILFFNCNEIACQPHLNSYINITKVDIKPEENMNNAMKIISQCEYSSIYATSNRMRVCEKSFHMTNFDSKKEMMNKDEILAWKSIILKKEIINELASRMEGVNLEVNYCKESNMEINDYLELFHTTSIEGNQGEIAIFIKKQEPMVKHLDLLKQDISYGL